MSTKTKNGQSKTRVTTQTVHIALPVPVLRRIRKMADAEERSINYKIKSLIQWAVERHGAVSYKSE